jgi:hypothetical protein
MRADDDDSTLPPGFSYMDPPPGSTARAADWEGLELMAQMLRRALEGDNPSSLRDEPLAGPDKRLAADHKTGSPRLG